MRYTISNTANPRSVGGGAASATPYSLICAADAARYCGINGGGGGDFFGILIGVMRIIIFALFLFLASVAPAVARAAEVWEDCYGLLDPAHDIAVFPACKDLAEQGEVRAQYAVGVMYTKGKGVRQDYAEAAKWFRKAAAQGHAKAQTNLGNMYDKGKGL